MTKQDVLKMIEALPDDVSVDEVIEELQFRAKVEERLAALDQGDKASHEEALLRLRKWQTG